MSGRFLYSLQSSNDKLHKIPPFYRFCSIGSKIYFGISCNYFLWSDDEHAELVAGEAEEKKDVVTDLSSDDVVTKYKAAAEIVNKTLAGAIKRVIEFLSYLFLCDDLHVSMRLLNIHRDHYTVRRWQEGD
jgi:hypothetical protein